MLWSDRSRCRWSIPVLAVVAEATVAAAATFTVINTSGSGAGSFEQAIIDANASADADDAIEFDIPGGGVPTIVDSLPAVTGPVLIDGTTQSAGFVELQNGGGTGLSITGSGSTVRGLVINSSSTGISLGSAAGNNTITGCRIGTNAAGTAASANQTGVAIQGPSGGNNTITNNLISGNNPNGITIVGSNNVVTGNVIGLDVTQTLALGSGTGITINNGTNNRIGGTGAGEGNVIAGLGTGISLQNPTAAGNVIQGNRIGTNASNASGLGVTTGVAFATVSGMGNVLGGAAPGAGNLIVAASSNGVAMTNSSNATIQGNTIGTVALPIASNGLDLNGSDNNTIEDNAISGNGAAGINIRQGADGNTVRRNDISGNTGIGISVSGGQMDRFTENSIHDNGGLGIDLGVNGVTENDALDADTASGFNDGQNFPVLSTVTAAQVTGTLNSTPDTEFTVEFFATPSCDASGNGEGQTFLGAIQATTDGSGDADLSFTLPPEAAGQVITATATAPDGDSSEFSDCSGTVPTTTTTSSLPPTTTTGVTTTTLGTTTTTTPTSTTVPTTTSTSSSTTTTSASTSSTTSTSTTTTTTTTLAASTSTTSTSSSTTSSAIAPTTTTSSSMTTTTLAGSCTTEPVGPTFRSLNCRLAALLVRVAASSDLGSFQGRLRGLLEQAKERKDEAEGFCREPDARRTNKRLKQGLRKMINLVHALRSLRARKSLPNDLREELIQAADGVRVDFRTLRRAVRCPADANA